MPLAQLENQHIRIEAELPCNDLERQRIRYFPVLIWPANDVAGHTPTFRHALAVDGVSRVRADREHQQPSQEGTWCATMIKAQCVSLWSDPRWMPEPPSE